MKRRHFITNIALSLTLPTIAMADDLVVQPLSPTSSETGMFADMANVGKYDLPKILERFQLENNLLVNLWIPSNVQELRPIIFSHSEFSSPKNYYNLLAHWASHGFMVIAPTHRDSILSDGLRIIPRDEKGNFKWDNKSEFNAPMQWDERVNDCKKIIDNLPLIEQATRVRINTDRIIMSGHSIGAFTAMTMIGTTALNPDGSIYQNQDKRVYASLLMSPQGVGVLGLNNNSWKNVNRPLMVITGNKDSDFTNQDPNTKLDSYAFSPAGYRHLAWFKQIKHESYFGQQIIKNSYEELVFNDLKAISTAFMSAYGLYKQDVFANLSNDFFSQKTENRVIMQYR